MPSILLQALNQSGSGELISLAEAARKPGRDTSPGGFECIRRDIRPSGNRSPRNCLRSGRGFVLLLGPEVEFQRPRLPDICDRR